VSGPRDDLAARIIHRLKCGRCAQGWECGGLSEDHFQRGAVLADLLADALAEERERVAQAIEAMPLPHTLSDDAQIAWRWGRHDAARIARGAGS
jgi:hypothetical protein